MPLLRSTLYFPEWKGPIEGWVVNTMRSQFWRVSRIMDHEDYMQEARCIYLRCAARYPMLDTPEHFMSLFKRAWLNRLHDLSRSNSAAALEVKPGVDEDGEDRIVADPIGETDCSGFVTTLMNQAPAEVRAVLALMLSAPAELLDLALQSLRGRSDRTLNRWLNARIGLPPRYDTVAQVRAHFGED